MAPELFTDEYSKATSATDVWAFAMTAIEVSRISGRHDWSSNYTAPFQIFTGRLPFSSIKRDEAVMYLVAKGKVPSREDYSELGDDIWCIFQQCWTPNPTQRPSIQNLSLDLNILAARRLDRASSPFPDVAHDVPQRLLSPRVTRCSSAAVCFSKPRAILHTFSLRTHGISCLLCMRLSKSSSEGNENTLTSPYPCQWENCQAQFDLLVDCQAHELRHKQATIDKHSTT
jgi:hypothetical protein